jgi:hypothetical protein
MTLAYTAIQKHAHCTLQALYFIFLKVQCTAVSYIFIFKTSEKKVCSFLTVFLLSSAYSFYSMTNDSPVAEFIVPGWGEKLAPAQGCRTGPPCYKGCMAGRYDNLLSESTISPQAGTINLATVLLSIPHCPLSLRPLKKRSLSFLLLESLFTSVSRDSKGHPSLVSLVGNPLRNSFLLLFLNL